MHPKSATQKQENAPADKPWRVRHLQSGRVMIQSARLPLREGCVMNSLRGWRDPRTGRVFGFQSETQRDNFMVARARFCNGPNHPGRLLAGLAQAIESRATRHLVNSALTTPRAFSRPAQECPLSAEQRKTFAHIEIFLIMNPLRHVANLTICCRPRRLRVVLGLKST